MATDNIDEIMEYLTSQRMASLANVARHFDIAPIDFMPTIARLESMNLIRVSNSRCQSDCTSCTTTCDQPTSIPKLTEQSIIISLQSRQEQL